MGFTIFFSEVWGFTRSQIKVQLMVQREWVTINKIYYWVLIVRKEAKTDPIVNFSITIDSQELMCESKLKKLFFPAEDTLFYCLL